ncbi:MAG: GNAT family N-acetyltransferase, partial [Micromonosporaceae bacterium]|nr:GNAT family N-acetyltransferase [Micromonosporaceae bacterium]
NATLAPSLPPRGRVGFFCQSGAFGIALLAAAAERGLGLSGFVSAGNRADVSGNDLLQHWRSDPATDVVLLYLETFGNPRKFARVARQLARHKPVVAVASQGSRGAGSEATALFAQHGVIRVGAVGELFDVGLLLACQPLPGGNRVGVVGNSTALVRLAVEAALAGGMRMPEHYPVNVGPSAPPSAFASALREAVADDETDAIVVAFVPQVGGSSSGYADVLVEEAAGADKPVVATFMAGGASAVSAVPAAMDTAAERGAVPAYGSVEEAVRALSRVAEYAAWRREPAGVVPDVPGVDPDAAREAIAARLASAEEPVLADGEAAPLLSAYGIHVVPSAAARCADEAAEAAERFGYPVALKVSAAALRGRLDLGAVRLELRDAAEVRRAYQAIAERFGADVAVLVQPMRPPGIACRVRLAQDRAFGPVVGFGLAGATAELLGDQSWRAAPLTDVDAARLVRDSRGAPMLFGYQGGEPARAPSPGRDASRESASSVDAAALEDLVLRVGLLADEQPQARALELNPVLAAPTGLAVLHASLTLGPPETRPDTGPRRLR